MTNRMSLPRARILVVAAIITGVGFGAVGAHALSTRETYGAIPADAMQPVGELDIAKVPDYVSVIGPHGEIAGHVSEVELFDEAPAQPWIERNPEAPKGEVGTEKDFKSEVLGKHASGIHSAESAF